ncbi:MAG: sugar ABC transporter substrate-binding protein, partial [Ruminococcus sp.]|nr:sugar ABC transporter substrate-binding protein [Ruminococcus sp.]
VELPMSSKTGERASIYNGLGWAAAANTDMPEEAWQLIEYLGSEEAQIKQAELGVTMSAYLGTSDTWINAAPEYNLQAYLNMWDNMFIFPHSKNTVAWDEAMDATMKEVWLGNMTMEEGCLKVAEEMNAILAEE